MLMTPLASNCNQLPAVYFDAFRFAAQYFFIRTETALFAAADIRFRLRFGTGGALPKTRSSIGTGTPVRPVRWGNSFTSDASSALSS